MLFTDSHIDISRQRGQSKTSDIPSAIRMITLAALFFPIFLGVLREILQPLLWIKEIAITVFRETSIIDYKNGYNSQPPRSIYKH